MPKVSPRDAAPAAAVANRAVRALLPFVDRRDFADAGPGLVAVLPGGIAEASGRRVWNLGDLRFSRRRGGAGRQAAAAGRPRAAARMASRPMRGQSPAATASRGAIHVPPTIGTLGNAR
jgi:hypothetical protein